MNQRKKAEKTPHEKRPRKTCNGKLVERRKGGKGSSLRSSGYLYLYIKYIDSFILILKDLEIEECIKWVDILEKGPRFLVDEEVFLRAKAGMVRTVTGGKLKAADWH